MTRFDLALAAVRAAAEMVRENAPTPTVVKRKGVADYVTQLDYDIQRSLISELRRIEPMAEIVSEELEDHDGAFSELTWVLDPIDGTTNLLHHNPYFAISLAFVAEEGASFGIVLNPVTGESFTAIQGCGAFLNGSHISVSSNVSLGQSIVSVGLPYDRAKAHMMFENMETVFMKCQDLRRGGSAALDLAYLACGRTDGYFEMDLRAWDYCAGALILREAGGLITDWVGGELVATAGTRSIVASNSRIHGELLSTLRT